MMINRVVKWGVERGINELSPNVPGFTKNIVEELGELIEAEKAGSINGQLDALGDIVVFCITEMSKYRADPNFVMDEVIKEINSRTGAYSEEFEKWVKDTSPEAQANWYKADFGMD